MNDITKSESRELAAQEQSTQFMQIIQGAISNPDINPDVIDKLLDAKHKHEAEQARRAYHRAMTAFRKRAPTIAKHRDVTVTKGGTTAAYAGLPETLEAIQSLEADLGLSHSWETDQQNDQIVVTCIISHEDGHTERTTLKAPADTTGSKNAVQSIGSTVSYLERYTLMAAFGLAAADMDDDGYQAGSRGVISDDQLCKIVEALDAADDKLDRDIFADWLRDTCHARGDTLSELLGTIPKSKFSKVMNGIKVSAERSKS